jgi:15-cis-phytoene desaturase
MQEFLGSMEGAVLSGKLAAIAIARDYSPKALSSPSEAKEKASLVRS